MTLAERKILGGAQRRRAPNVLGVFGLLQPLADGLKLMIKEFILPTNVNIFLFILAPVITFTCTMLYWSVTPLGKGYVFADLNIGALFIYAISSLSVYGIILAGWSSNIKYSFMGGIRSAAQMVSYELSIGLILVTIFLLTGSLNMSDIVMSQSHIWYMVPLFPAFVMFLVAILAECNRHPFDLPEAEGELVSGFNTEYSAMGFALFFIGEYGNVVFMSVLTTILFCGGWLPLFGMSFIPGPIWLITRATFPRFRYDQLMRLGWKSLLPISLGWFLFVASLLITFNLLPYNLYNMEGFIYSMFILVIAASETCIGLSLLVNYTIEVGDNNTGVFNLLYA
ncbi:hypothetical protein WA158_002654 [Blastocystis sp. Blastoise]